MEAQGWFSASLRRDNYHYNKYRKGQILNAFKVKVYIQAQLVPCHQRKVGGKKHKTIRVDQQVFTNLDKDMIDVKCI